MKAILFDERGLKECKICKIPKTKEEYYKSGTYKSGYRPECKACCGDLGRKYPKTKEQVREQKLKMSYGLTLADYDRMFAEQGGVCKICKKPQQVKRKGLGIAYHLAVDHCHKTGKVRGLLCDNCNSGLGHFKDDKMNVLQAAIYLEEFELKMEQ